MHPRLCDFGPGRWRGGWPCRFHRGHLHEGHPSGAGGYDPNSWLLTQITWSLDSSHHLNISNTPMKYIMNLWGKNAGYKEVAYDFNDFMFTFSEVNSWKNQPRPKSSRFLRPPWPWSIVALEGKQPWTCQLGRTSLAPSTNPRHSEVDNSRWWCNHIVLILKDIE